MITPQVYDSSQLKMGRIITYTWLESISNGQIWGQIWGVYRPKGAPIDHNLATKSVKCPPSPGGDNFPPLPRARGGRRRCPFVAK